MSKKLQQRAPVVHSSSTNGRHFLLQIHFLIISPVNDYEHEKFFYFSHLDFRAEAAGSPSSLRYLVTVRRATLKPVSYNHLTKWLSLAGHIL